MKQILWLLKQLILIIYILILENLISDILYDFFFIKCTFLTTLKHTLLSLYAISAKPIMEISTTKFLNDAIFLHLKSIKWIFSNKLKLVSFYKFLKDMILLSGIHGMFFCIILLSYKVEKNVCNIFYC